MTNKPATHSFNNFSQVHSQAKLHPSVKVGAFSIIHEQVEIGEGTEIAPHVVIYPGVKIGKNCKISSHTVITPETQSLAFGEEESPETPVYLLGKVPGIQIDDHVHIEPSVTLHGEITIGSGCWIGSGTTIHDGARIGKKCRIFPGAIISAIPQDLKFEGEKTTLEIGDGTTIRECATLNRGTKAYGKTVIGKNCLLMAYVHVAHDCIIGDRVVMANSVNLAGHVEIEDDALMGGTCAVQQFVKIGKHAFVTGGSKVRKDVPPYIKVGREPVQYQGVNSIGLRRKGYEAEKINEIMEIYRHVFLSGRNNTRALGHIETHLAYSEERDCIVNFIRNSERGIVKGLPHKQ
jgi:UDP-N-acetylglucosamine acyltransferase